MAQSRIALSLSLGSEVAFKTIALSMQIHRSVHIKLSPRQSMDYSK